MARTALTTQPIDSDGLTPVFAAANVDGHIIDADAYIEVVNGSGGSINVTVQTPAEYAGLAVAERIIAVGAGARAKIGHFDPKVYARPTGVADPGKVYVDFSAVTSVTVGAFR